MVYAIAMRSIALSLLLCSFWFALGTEGQAIGDVVRSVVINAAQLTYKEPFGHGALFSDVNGDGNRDIVVGQPLARGGEGVVTFLLLHANATLKGYIHMSQFDLIGTRQLNSGFAASVQNIGDVDGDGNDDLAVGHAGMPCFSSCLLSVRQVRSFIFACRIQDGQGLRAFHGRTRQQNRRKHD